MPAVRRNIGYLRCKRRQRNRAPRRVRRRAADPRRMDGRERTVRRLPHLVAGVIICLFGVATGSERHWQTGTCTDASVKRDLTVGQGATGSRPFGPPRPGSPPVVPQVVAYVIETQDQRFEVKDIHPIGSDTLNLMVGDQVTFAVTKNTVYIRDAKGHEHRFRLTRKTRKPATTS
jgi:hypothetical protein